MMYLSDGIFSYKNVDYKESCELFITEFSGGDKYLFLEQYS